MTTRRDPMDNKFDLGLVIAIYCGVPQALECFRTARKELEERGLL